MLNVNLGVPSKGFGVAQFTDIETPDTLYVVHKVSADTKYKQNPNKIKLNKGLRPREHHMTP